MALNDLQVERGRELDCMQKYLEGASEGNFVAKCSAAVETRWRRAGRSSLPETTG